MSNWDGFNRRKFPRVNYPCLVVIHQNKEKEDVILSHTENVGIGGVCVILKQNVKLFTEVSLEVDVLDLEKHIKCKGKVVWNVQRKTDEKKKPLFYDIGIEFQELEKKDQERLEGIVLRLVKAQKIHPQK